MNITTIRQPRAATRLHLAEAGKGQFYLVAASNGQTRPSRAASEAYTQVAEVLAETGAEIVHERIFASLRFESQVRTARRKALGHQGIPYDGPLTYIQGHPPWGEGFAGAIIRAITPSGKEQEVWTIADDEGSPCGRGWRRNGASFLVLQNLHGLVKAFAAMNEPLLQARRIFFRAEQILREQGVSYHDVIRTWFYLSDMLNWYTEFNEARNAKYEQFGIMPAPGSTRLLLPASTGVQGDNPQGAAAAMDLIAMTGPAHSRPLLKQLRNPAQKDAFRYGSAFSRGALIRESDVSLIEVSGTAAINEAGVSMHPEDIRAQIDCTFAKIEALIRPEGATLDDFCAATVFVKHPDDWQVFRDMAAERGLEDFPGVCIVSDICRDELLFEIDGEVAFGGK